MPKQETIESLNLLTSSAVDPLRSTEPPELFLGVVGPVGTDLDLLSNLLLEQLHKVDYKAETIKLSRLIRTIDEFKDIEDYPEDKRIRDHMNAGTTIRERTARGDILALMATAAIREHRKRSGNEPYRPLKRQAYILRSLKHPDEVRALRDIYGSAFFLFSVYAPREARVNSLAKKIAESHGTSNEKKFRAEAENLVNRDEEEEGRKLGQDVTDAFPLADFFVEIGPRTEMQKQLSRIFEILFGHPFHTPSRDELGMHLARTVALRSSDLSRQVGAAIMSIEGDIISIGCNEVPRPLGGFYWPASESDHRDFQKGVDSSAKYKRQIIKEMLVRLQKADCLGKNVTDGNVDELTDQLLYGDKKETFYGAQIVNLLEYGRSVHAEMAAITDAARRGISVANCILYATTFPCHMCARHILAAGIAKVVYIEPYPKSMAKDLYQEAISFEEEKGKPGKVEFLPFVGVAPRAYQRLFESVKRKDSRGDATKWSASDSSPRVKKLVVSYIVLEREILNFIPEALKKASFKIVE